MNRRQLIKLGMMMGAAKFIPLNTSLANSKNDHNFLQIIYRGGWDVSYLFDGRPLKGFTQGNKAILQNYTNLNPYLWDTNDGSTLASTITKPLESYKDDICLVKGLHMSNSFDGHIQNLNFALTGNPFGGDSFLPKLNNQNYPIDGISSGRLRAKVTNHSNIIPLDPTNHNLLISMVNKYLNSADNSVIERARINFGLNSNTSTYFGSGSKNLLSSLDNQNALLKPFTKMKSVKVGNNDLASKILMIQEFFKSKACRSGILILDHHQLDTHAPAQAKTQPQMYKKIVAEIKLIIDLFKESGLINTTSVSITSEFSRTMRQLKYGNNVSETGTNHNPFNNIAILFGKDIKGNQVIGSSDFESIDEELSDYHYKNEGLLDSKNNNRCQKIFGRPFNHQAGRTYRVDELNQNPKISENEDNYLYYTSIINGFYKKFGVDQSHFLINNTRDKKIVSPLSRIFTS